MKTEQPIFKEYGELERFAWRMHDVLAGVRDREKADPDHLLDLPRIKRIAAMDAVLYAFEEWSRDDA